MAKRQEHAAKLIVKVVTGANSAGAPTYANRSFAHINPELSDADTLAIGQKLGALQTRQVGGILRADSFAIVEGE